MILATQMHRLIMDTRRPALSHLHALTGNGMHSMAELGSLTSNTAASQQVGTMPVQAQLRDREEEGNYHGAQFLDPAAAC
jgi:hypothetical protein